MIHRFCVTGLRTSPSDIILVSNHSFLSLQRHWTILHRERPCSHMTNGQHSIYFHPLSRLSNRWSVPRSLAKHRASHSCWIQARAAQGQELCPTALPPPAPAASAAGTASWENNPTNTEFALTEDVVFIIFFPHTERRKNNLSFGRTVFSFFHSDRPQCQPSPSPAHNGAHPKYQMYI